MMLNEKSQTPKSTNCMILFIGSSGTSQTIPRWKSEYRLPLGLQDCLGRHKGALGDAGKLLRLDKGVGYRGVRGPHNA